VAFVALKAVGATVLIALGIQSLRAARRQAADDAVAPADTASTGRRRHPFRDGLTISLANPKLAVFFVALFPQFVGRRGTVLSTTLVMAALIVVFDFAWYTSLSVLVSRANWAFDASRMTRWLERISGSVLVALGIRVAAESR
jgi:threonine/homoserine/homoserine lactone efflux protein